MAGVSRSFGSRADPLDEGEAVHAGHLDVDEEQRVVGAARPFEPLLARCRHVDLVARRLEDALLEHARGQRIVDDEDRAFSRHRGSAAARRREAPPPPALPDRASGADCRRRRARRRRPPPWPARARAVSGRRCSTCQGAGRRRRRQARSAPLPRPRRGLPPRPWAQPRPEAPQQQKEEGRPPQGTSPPPREV